MWQVKFNCKKILDSNSKKIVELLSALTPFYGVADWRRKLGKERKRERKFLKQNILPILHLISLKFI